MAREYTSYQQQAISSDATDICVAAGAGSGKTGVLVERYLRLILDSRKESLSPQLRAGVDNILVITFTDKATREMKARIVKALLDENLLDERRQIETAYISTIHGFCSRLLQENPFEAGVDPQFRVLEEPKAKRLFRQVYEGVIAAAYREDSEEIIELVASLQANRQRDDASDPLITLVGAVESVINRLRGAGRSYSEVERHYLAGERHTLQTSQQLVHDWLQPIWQEIESCRQTLDLLKSGLRMGFASAYQTLVVHTAHKNNDTVSIQDTVVSLNEILRSVTSLRDPHTAPDSREAQVFQCFQRIRNACDEAKALHKVLGEREEEAQRACYQFWGVLLKVWDAYIQEKLRQGVLDTEDLQTEALRLLETSPEVRLRYRERFLYLMVDEFQDTNAVQMRLIEVLHTPESDLKAHYRQEHFVPASREARENYLFVVGDVQQSIYAFRNAEPSLFRELERTFREESGGLHVPLSVNFRSRPEILRLIRRVFGRIWQNEATPFVPLTKGAEFANKNLPSVEIILSKSLSRSDYLVLEAEAIATRIGAIVSEQQIRITHAHDPRFGEPIDYRDIAVLLRTTTQINAYERAFARQGIPFFVVSAGRGYYTRFEVRDILNLLTVLETPLNDVALVATLRSPFVGLSLDTLHRLRAFTKNRTTLDRDAAPLYFEIEPLLESGQLERTEAEKLRQFVAIMLELRQVEDRLPVGQALERVITKTHYDARLLCRPEGRRRLANVRKLLQMANSDSVVGVREFITRLRDLEKISEREGDAPTEEEAANVVRFFTIHGAKGLEFPLVILADMSSSLSYAEKSLFVCDPHRLAMGTRIIGTEDAVYKTIAEQKRQRELKESERLLYVAMTRAREHLILSGLMGARGENWAAQVFPLLGLLEAGDTVETRLIGGQLEALVAPHSTYTTGQREVSEVHTRHKIRQRAEDLVTVLLEEVETPFQAR